MAGATAGATPSCHHGGWRRHLHDSAAFALANLVGQEENHPAIMRDVDRCVPWMVERLRAAVERRAWPEDHTPDVWLACRGLSGMAIADSNKGRLGDAGAVELLVRVLRLRDEAHPSAEARAKEFATAGLWALAFHDGNKARVQAMEEALPALREIKEWADDATDDEAVVAAMRRAQKNAAAVLWMVDKDVQRAPTAGGGAP